jgi:peptidoglycan/xylan/chitin deacetylase (PgdA/CDA1 family)
MHDLGPKARNEYSIKTAGFERYVQWLHDNGYQTVLLRDVAAYLAGTDQLPPKPVVITFDDNWKSAIKIAEPILRKHGYVAVSFLIASSVGANDRRLTWEDCKALAAAGWEIGSHSKTHEVLTRAPKGQTRDSIQGMVEDQVRGSKELIESQTGLEITSFAYPYGNYDEAAMQALQDAGYTVAVSIDRSTADEQSEPLRLPRRMIMNATSFATFQRVCQAKALHVADLSPAPGERVTGEQVTITGTLSDADVTAAPTGEAMSEPLVVGLETATRKLTVQASLQRGANSIALRGGGRETSWLVFRDG